MIYAAHPDRIEFVASEWVGAVQGGSFMAIAECIVPRVPMRRWVKGPNALTERMCRNCGRLEKDFFGMNGRAVAYMRITASVSKSIFFGMNGRGGMHDNNRRRKLFQISGRGCYASSS